jgi:hypothetical protein
MKKALAVTGIVLIFFAAGAFAFLSARLWQANGELKSELETQKVSSERREAVLQGNFLSADGFGSSGKDEYFASKEKLISAKADFVNVDLAGMKLTLYEKGAEKAAYPVLTKGREGSWWETPTGEYTALSKETNHFSSIGKVWMPWSIQFYGNFFIHGWPYHPDGSPVEAAYSGGCVRLATEDAKKVFDFVSRGMPILIYEVKPDRRITPVTPAGNAPAVPALTAESAIVADLDTGDIFLDKNADMPLELMSVTKLMTAVVASELIYLERGITISSGMVSDPVQSYPLAVGKSYKAFDLFYPMLMQSSNGSARALGSFIGEKEFVRQMNEKAKTLGMANTTFADTPGIKEENKGSLKDVARLMKYIADKRFFIFDITRGKKLSIFSEGELSSIKNFNDFAGDPRLLGMKNGKLMAIGETIAAVFILKDGNGAEHRIFIGVLRSADRKGDTEKLLGWTEAAFGLK